MSSTAELGSARAAAILAGRGLLRGMYATWRVRVLNDAAWCAMRQRGEPFILTLWHGDLLPLLVHHRGQGIAVLISEHRDGETVARVAHGLGLRTVRGSSTRGGARAIAALVRELRQGREVAITPDGPRGPARKFAPGALVAAQRAGAPLVPIGVHVDRAWRLNSWDRFVIPKPFARVTIAYGEPTRVHADTPREAAKLAARFETLMDEAGRFAANG